MTRELGSVVRKFLGRTIFRAITDVEAFEEAMLKQLPAVDIKKLPQHTQKSIRWAGRGSKRTP